MMFLKKAAPGRGKGRPAALPGLADVRTGNAALDAWMGAVRERLEVREGQRGDPQERAVTVREIDEMRQTIHYLTLDKEPGEGEIKLDLGGGLSASIAIDKFIDSIKNLQLFKDLLKSLDDPSRFDHLPEQIRKIVLQDLMKEARARGAAITRVETVANERFSSLAVTVDTLTAAVQDAASGIRHVAYAYADANRAMAGQITQLETSLGKYYQDGKPGRAKLEQEMLTQADRTNGLRAQYTLKVQAGKAIAGFGLAATESTEGHATSAFIIAANKFAVVDPSTYTGGLVTTPNVAYIPFGVDSNGIYLNNNVYVRGNMRVQTGSKRIPLANGLRGSVHLYRSGTWSDHMANQAVHQVVGASGSSYGTEHLVIGDTVTFTSGSTQTTKAWMGSSWSNPGVAISGDVLIDGTVAARKINTNGLTVKDASGRVILGSGTFDLNMLKDSYGRLNVKGLEHRHVHGLGGLATENHVNLFSSKVRIPVAAGSQTTRELEVGDLVSKLSRIRVDNIGNFMDAAAIGSAYIGNAAIGSAHIQQAAIGTAHVGTLNFTEGNAHKITVDAASIRNLKVKWADIEQVNITSTQIANARIEWGQIDKVRISWADIKDAVVQNLRVGTLQIDNGAVTSMSSGNGGGISVPPGASRVGAVCWVNQAAGASGTVVMAHANVYAGSNSGVQVSLVRDGRTLASVSHSIQGGFRSTCFVAGFDGYPPAGLAQYTVQVRNIESSDVTVHDTFIVATGGKR